MIFGALNFKRPTFLFLTSKYVQRVGEIDILTYWYINMNTYVKYRGGYYGYFGVSRSTVKFLNNILLVLEVFLFVKRKFSY